MQGQRGASLLAGNLVGGFSSTAETLVMYGGTTAAAEREIAGDYVIFLLLLRFFFFLFFPIFPIEKEVLAVFRTQRFV